MRLGHLSRRIARTGSVAEKVVRLRRGEPHADGPGGSVSIDNRNLPIVGTVTVSQWVFDLGTH